MLEISTYCLTRSFNGFPPYFAQSSFTEMKSTPDKEVHHRQKLTTDFFKLFELTILVVTISIARKNMLPGGHFLRGLITKS